MDALATVLPLLLIGGVFYLLIFRPMQRRNRDFAATQAALAPGAQVMMGGGMLATVVTVDDDDVVVEAAPGVQLRYTRQGVVKVMAPSPVDRDDSAGPAGLTD